MVMVALSKVAGTNSSTGLIVSIVKVNEEFPKLPKLSLAHIVTLCGPSLQVIVVMLVSQGRVILSNIESLLYQQDSRFVSEVV